MHDRVVAPASQGAEKPPSHHANRSANDAGFKRHARSSRAFRHASHRHLCGDCFSGGGSEVIFVNQHANTAGAGAFQEALYVDTLVLNAGSSITLDNCRVYCNHLIDHGAQIDTVGFGTLLFDLSKPVPTVAEWGVVTMTLLVLTAGTLAIARRRRHAAR